MDAADSSQRELQLQRAARDLVALSTLPALWVGYEERAVAQSLGEVLLKILGVHFVVVLVRHGESRAVTAVGARGRPDGDAQELRAALASWLAGDPSEPLPPLRGPEGAALRPALARFGHSGEQGLVLALSPREDFPSDVERMLLSVGANQTAMVLQRKRDEEALRRQNRALETLIQFSSELAGERDVESVTKAVVEAGRELTGAAFGAFFYNVVGATGDSYMLYTLAGARREDFEGFPMPRASDLFAPTFRGEGTLRAADVRLDPRYGKLPPYHGLPPGHLPVRSYLATPVVSRSGEVIGGLFFGHPEPGVFGAESERVVEGLAAHAAIAFDNARLYRSLQAELAERQAVEEALRGAAARKDDFLAMLSHELRNPLAPIRNCLHILERVDDDAAQRGRARSVMERQVLHLTRLVDDLLDVSRISRGKIQLRRGPVDLQQLVQQTAEDHRAPFAEAGIDLDVHLCETAAWVDGDRVRLSQCLGNLLENARKFTSPGGRVKVALVVDATEAVIRVGDDGVGIAAGDLPHIFEPFRQASSTPGLRSGLGLGLAVVKSLVELHGGAVEAFSEGPGRGTEIVLRLPVAADAAEAEPRAPRGEPATAPAEHRVLVIEDNVDAAETLSELLRLHGHRVQVAYDARSGLAAARDFVPHVVLCDIGLPGGMDGYAVARSIRREPLPARPLLIALTGFGLEADRQRALEAGFDAHLTKPADPAALERLLTERRPPPGSTAANRALATEPDAALRESATTYLE